MAARPKTPWDLVRHGIRRGIRIGVGIGRDMLAPTAHRARRTHRRARTALCSSWVRLDRILDVPEEGIRREGAILDRATFEAVAARLRAHYGWS